jgi:hypothetical protein
VVSWFSSSAPARLSQPKYWRAAARTLGVTIFRTQSAGVGGVAVPGAQEQAMPRSVK